MTKELFDTAMYSRIVSQKPVSRADLICKIFDRVKERTNGCYKCMFDQSFLFNLALMDEEELKSYLDNEKYKASFTKHEGALVHDLKIL